MATSTQSTGAPATGTAGGQGGIDAAAAAHGGRSIGGSIATTSLTSRAWPDAPASSTATRCGHIRVAVDGREPIAGPPTVVAGRPQTVVHADDIDAAARIAGVGRPIHSRHVDGRDGAVAIATTITAAIEIRVEAASVGHEQHRDEDDRSPSHQKALLAEIPATPRPIMGAKTVRSLLARQPSVYSTAPVASAAPPTP